MLFHPWVLEAIVALAASLAGSHKNHEAMEAFTGSVINQLNCDYSCDFNFLVWHSNKGHRGSRENLHETTHNHTELDIPLGGTEGYESHAFDYGNFSLAGDGGYINWRFDGSYLRFKDGEEHPEGHDVTFYPKGAQQAHKRADNQVLGRDAIAGRGDNTLPAFNSGIHQKRTVHDCDAFDKSVCLQQPELGAAPERAPRFAADTGARDTPNLNDGTYFVFCNATGEASVNSGVAYYRDFNPGQNVGHLPDDLVWVDHSHLPYFRKSTGVAEFLGGEATVKWNIFGGGPESNQPGAFTGSARDGSDRFFMYRDDSKLLFETEQYQCFSQYYAF